MKQTALDISVVICAYTEERWGNLVAAVDSIERQYAPPREIIVVIDHNPGLLARARASMPNIIVEENKEARGLSGARNSGVAVAQGAVVAFLDDDAIAAPDWLEQLWTAYSDLNIVGVGGMIEPLWEDGRPAWFPTEFDWVVGCTYRGMPEVTSPVRNLIGANMSFRREVFDEIGAFQLGYGCDETHFCIRIRQKWPNKFLLYVPKAKAFHRVPAYRSNWNYFRTRCYFEGGSKAVVSWLVGMQDGLSSEWNYAFRTLPQGVVRGLLETILGRNQFGLAQSGTIAVGLAITIGGYLMGKLFVQDAARQRGWGPA